MVAKDTVNAFNTAYGSATATVGADPVVVSPSAPDFHLTGTSLCINNGVDVSLTRDYTGMPIIGLPDIGAYEFIAASGGLGLSPQL